MTVEALTYPLPRRKRTGPPSSLDLTIQAAAGGIIAPPRSRLIPWTMTITVSQRRTLSTPRLIGPAILRRFFYGTTAVAAPPVGTLELGWAPNPLTENGVAVTTVRPYTPLTELQNPFGVGTLGGQTGIVLGTIPNQHIQWEGTADLIVTEAQFVFTVSFISGIAGAGECHGRLLVLEAVNPEALSAFTGS